MKKIFSTILVFYFIFFVFTSGRADTSPDAIAMRVIPNPNHHSPMRWYAEKGFTGSPQSLVVDGFEAIRDGRSVYVNAANPSGSTLYTNIYLLSYTQQAENATVDIFGQLLSHWKFANNVIGTGNCSSASSTACVYNSECPEGEYCTSPKANLIRDTKRLADLADIQTALENYKAKNGHYPSFNSGSYLPNISISTWPSWQATLGKELGINLPVDPINQLGNCGGTNFNPATCWDENAKKFADPNPANNFLDLPASSSAYIYVAPDAGSKFTLDLGIKPTSYFTKVTIKNPLGTNQAPQFIGSNLPNGHSGSAYSGYIEASDPDKDALAWTVDALHFQSTTTGEIVNWNTGDTPDLLSTLKTKLLWDTPSLLTNALTGTRREISANKIGKAGVYTFTVSVDDGKGAANSKTSQDFTLIIDNTPPEVQDIANQSIVIGKILNFAIKVKDTSPSITVNFRYPANPTTPPFSLSCANIAKTTNAYNFTCTVASNIIADTGDYAFEATAVDFYGEKSAPKTFTISVQNNPPVVTTTSLPQATACADYNAQINAADPDGHNLVYSATGLPANLALDPAAGAITNIPQAAGNYVVNVNVRDEYFSRTSAPYSADISQSYALNVIDEVFTVSESAATSTIYVFVGGVPFYTPVTYFGNAAVSTSNHVTYSLQNNPSWLHIDPSSGAIQGTPTDNAADPGTYNVIVRATNDCGASATANFTITVLPNIVNCIFKDDGTMLFNCIISYIRKYYI